MQKTFQSIVKSYLKKDKIENDERKRINDLIDKKERQIERLKKKKEKLEYVYWTEEILKPLAEELKVLLNKKHTEILGPFGLTNRTSIWFWNTKKERDNCKVKSITFRPFNLSKGELQVETRKQYRPALYSPGTIGDANGGNTICEPVPKDANFDWFIKRIK